MKLLKGIFLLTILSCNVCLAESGKTTEGQILTWLLSTFFILAIIFVLAYLLKKTRLVKKNFGRLSIENQLYIGQKQKILLVKAGDKRILVGVTPTNISYLTDYKDEKTEFDTLLKEHTQEEKKNDENK